MRIFDRFSYILIAISATFRTGILLFYQPRLLGDTIDDYFTIGKQLTSWNFEGYLGRRVPLYPLITTLFGYNTFLLWLLNSILGVIIVLLIYNLFKILFNSPQLGFLAGLTYALNPSQLLIESLILPETLSIFWVLFTLLMFFDFTVRNKIPTKTRLILTGTAAALCPLTHGRLQFFPLLVVAFFVVWLMFLRKVDYRRVIAYTGLIMLPILIIDGGWATFQYTRIGSFCMSPNSAFIIIHMVDKIECKDGDEYQDIKKEIIFERDRFRAKGTESLWAPDLVRVKMMRDTGISYIELMRIYKKIAFAEIAKHPLFYARSVIKAWIQYFRPAWYSSNSASIGGALQGNNTLNKVMALVYAFGYVVLLLAFGLYGIQQILVLLRKSYKALRFEIVFIYVLIACSCFITGLIVIGENARYKMTFEPLILACGIAWLYFTATGLLTKPNAKRSAKPE